MKKCDGFDCRSLDLRKSLIKFENAQIQIETCLIYQRAKFRPKTKQEKGYTICVMSVIDMAVSEADSGQRIHLLKKFKIFQNVR